MMFRLSLLLSLFLAAFCADNEYDCRRINDCMNQGKCITEESDPNLNGKCNCVSPFTGYRCETDSSAPCTKDCKNSGVCYVKDTVETCSCIYGYIGEFCETEAVMIDCSGSSVRFDITFPDKFTGLVKIDKDELATSAPAVCDFDEITTSGLKNYSLEIFVNKFSDTSVCGKDQLIEVINGDITVYTARFRVQYMPTLVTHVDEIYNLTCVHSGEDTMVYKEITNVFVNTLGNLTVIDKNNTYRPLQVDLLNDEGKPLSAEVPLYIGDMFVLHVYLTDKAVYDNLRVETCTANNTLAGAAQKTFKLFDKGCPTNAGKSSARGQTVEMKDFNGEQLNGKKINIWAFKFIDSDMLGFVCSVKVCKPDDVTGCNVPDDCDLVRNTPDAPEPTDAPTDAPTTLAPTTDGGRKKRAAGDNGVEEKTFSAVIRVNGPREYNPNGQAGSSTEPGVMDCLSQGEIMAVIWVLGAVVVILFIAVIVLACIIINRRHGPKNAFEPPKPYAVRTDRFQLPRAHVNQAYREA